MVKYGSIMKIVRFFLGTDSYLATELTPNSSDCNPKSQILFAAGPILPLSDNMWWLSENFYFKAASETPCIP